MASLSKDSLASLKRSVDDCKSQWLLACLSDERKNSTILGPVGFFDWRLHGQLSKLVRRDSFHTGELCLISGPKRLGTASLLLFIHGKNTKSSELVARLKKLGIDSLSIEETSFPEDFFARLKQNLDKEGISWTKLDWAAT